MNDSAVVSHEGFGDTSERLALSDGPGPNRRHVVKTNDHVLGWNGDGTSIRRLEDVVRREHQHTRLRLSFNRERKVNGHLVTVEVSVERCTDERVKLDCLAFNELRLERLDSQAVKGRCAVQQNGAVANDFFELSPHLGVRTFNGALCALDRRCESFVLELLDDVGLEQFKGHLLGQTTLVQFELRADDDDRTARVVDSLSEKVLTESTLLTLEHVAERLESTVTGAGNGTSASAIVEQRVNGFLEHALLVVLDDLRGLLLIESLETVVAVDDTTVEVVEVGRCETSTVELNHRAKVGRNHRNHAHHHRLRKWNIARVLAGGHEEGVDNLESLDRANLALSLAVLDFVAKNVGSFLQLLTFVDTEVLEDIFDGLCTHESGEVRCPEGFLRGVSVSTEVVDEETECNIIGLEVIALESAERIPGDCPLSNVVVKRLANVGDFTLGQLACLALHICFRFFSFELGEVSFVFLLTLSDFLVANLLEIADLGLDALLEHRKVFVNRGLVDVRDHVRGEVDDLFEVLRCHVEEVTETARDTLEVPNVSDRCCEFDVTHAFTTNCLTSYLNTTALTRDALETDTLVLAAGALPVLRRSEDLFTEQTVLLGLQGAVVDGLRLLDLTAGP